MLKQLTGIFRSFLSHDVKYVVIGGIAAILHGVPRATFDIDLLIDPTRDNAQSLLDAMQEAGFATATLINAEQLTKNEITVFKDRVRIDVQTSTPGLLFATAWQNRLTMNFDGQTYYVVSKQDLISAKKAAGRKIDLEDVRLLELSDKP